MSRRDEGEKRNCPQILVRSHLNPCPCRHSLAAPHQSYLHPCRRSPIVADSAKRKRKRERSGMRRRNQMQEMEEMKKARDEIGPENKRRRESCRNHAAGVAPARTIPVPLCPEEFRYEEKKNETEEKKERGRTRKRNAEKPRTWSKEEIKKEKSKTGKKEEKKNGRGIFGISRK